MTSPESGHFTPNEIINFSNDLESDIPLVARMYSERTGEDAQDEPMSMAQLARQEIIASRPDGPVGVEPSTADVEFIARATARALEQADSLGEAKIATYKTTEPLPEETVRLFLGE